MHDTRALPSTSSLAQPILAGVVMAMVGFFSSFAVILKGLTAAGANEAQAASGLMALSIAMGLCGLLMSLIRREPLSAAWSTPGAALLAANGAAPGGEPAAIGAFLIVGLMLIAAGFVRPLGRAVAAIPAPLANAMLAGVLFGLCLAPVKALAQAPLAAGAVIIVWLVVWRLRRLYATPAAALAAGLIIALSQPGSLSGDLFAHPVLIAPTFSLTAAISVALPLFIVTMASQNLPGAAVLKSFGFEPPIPRMIAATGVFTALAAPFGGHAVNLSAITAAMCASSDASPDRNKRWIASATAGVLYVAMGLGAGAVTRFAAGSPVLVEAVAGLALLGALGGALHAALAEFEDREAALITFLVAASGVSFYGIGGAFWGLLAGGAIMAVRRAGVSPPPPKPPA